MSRSNKARHGTRTKKWKDSVGKSRSQARSRAKWKKVKKNTKRPAYGSRQGKRQPKPSFEDKYEWDGHKHQGKIVEYDDPTGLYPPMRLAVMTGKSPDQFKNRSGK